MKFRINDAAITIVTTVAITIREAPARDGRCNDNHNQFQYDMLYLIKYQAKYSLDM